LRVGAKRKSSTPEFAENPEEGKWKGEGRANTHLDRVIPLLRKFAPRKPQTKYGTEIYIKRVGGATKASRPSAAAFLK